MLRGRDGPCDASYGTPYTGIVPSLPDTPSASDEHQCTTVVQGGALRHSNLYFCAEQLKLSIGSLQKRLNINNGTS